MAVGFTGGDKLDKVLADIARKLSNADHVSVGFFEGATEEDGTSIPMIAAIQNYGAPEAGIPPRPFFSNMVRDESPTWGKELAAKLKENDYDAAKSLDGMGIEIHDALQTSITNTNDPPLKPETIRRKGFPKPLVKSGDMKKAVKWHVSTGANE